MVSDIKIQKVALLAQRLLSLQPNNHQALLDPKIVLDGNCGDASESGRDFIFHTPSRFFVDMSKDNGLLLEDESSFTSTSIQEEWRNHVEPTVNQSRVDAADFYGYQVMKNPFMLSIAFPIGFRIDNKGNEFC